ncbi:MAG TPA: hypothetical protein VNA16_08390, partial [Abditibacteriaceae bacterium]|nr:hypothetical protein [Abditibacteriaceae bacterium]
MRRPETRLVRQTGVLAGKREAVSIDVVALATRHPAWQLADALERTQPVLLAFSPVNVPGAPGSPQTLPDAASLASPALPPLRAAPRATFSGFAASGYSPGFFRPELRVAATGFDALEWTARQRQDQALAAFIGDVATAQNASLKTRRLSLEAGLEDDIEVAQRMGLAELEPSLLPDPMQLEMTNLRLRLLEQLYITEPERTAAEKRLQVLEAEWEEKLRRQETERLAELT